jgi:hypothetical protein
MTIAPKQAELSFDPSVPSDEDPIPATAPDSKLEKRVNGLYLLACQLAEELDKRRPRVEPLPL